MPTLMRNNTKINVPEKKGNSKTIRELKRIGMSSSLSKTMNSLYSSMKNEKVQDLKRLDKAAKIDAK